MIAYDKELQLHQIDKIPAFEGWYFRILDNHISIAVIIGIAKTQEKQEVFIQVFHTLSPIMEKVSYDISDFYYQVDPFEIRIHNSVFQKHYIHIEDDELSVIVDLHINDPLHLRQTKYAPTIMGPFAYLKNMQCNHAVINLESQTYGYMKYLDKIYNIQGTMYQEKDWGYSFPKKYIWVQSQYCIQKKAILFLSCATIPLRFINFTGIIMVLVIDGKQYQFASYYGAILVKRQMSDGHYFLVIRQGKFRIELSIKTGLTYTLDAPENGRMLRNVEESLLGQVELRMYKYNKCQEVLSFQYCGIENDHFFL